MRDALTTIPVVDLRRGGPVRHAREARERARALRDECVSWLPRPLAALLPAIDAVTRNWLRRSRSPYVAEIEHIAAALPYPGIWFFNGCYQWGCTALAHEDAGVPWLIRTLDWPFPGLGRHLEVAHMRGPAGEFNTVTWPGYVGALTGSAPGRFAACINQAPMRRRTRHPWLRPYDFALNALHTRRLRFIPPDHLLREVFETCNDFNAARRMLETTPIARPAIFTLVGCKAGERCVVERTEEAFVSRDEDAAAANDWLHVAPQWEARISSEVMFTRSYEEAAERSRARREQLAAWSGRADGSFDWVTPPVLNAFTRLAVEMCPATGMLRAIGYERVHGAELPEPVTLPCVVAVAPASSLPRVAASK